MEFENRASKTYYSNYLKAVEKIKTIDINDKAAAYKSQLSQMEMNLKNIQKFEKNIDLSSLTDEFNQYKNAINSIDTQKSTTKDEDALKKSIDSLFLLLNETKFNSENIDLQVENSTKPIERDLNIFKTKFPTVDTKIHEDRIKDFQSKFRMMLEGGATQINNTNTLKEDIEHILLLKNLSWQDVEDEYFIYGSHNPTGNLYLPDYIWSQAGIDKLQQILEEYTQRFASFQAKYDINELVNLYQFDSRNTGLIAKDGNNHDYKTSSIISFAKDLLNKTKTELYDVNVKLKALEDVSDFVVEHYFNNKVNALKWINASNLFSNIPAIVEVGKKHQELWDTYGSLEDYKDKLRNNSIKRAKLVHLPKAVKHDDEIEALAKIAFEQKGWNEEVLKVILLGHDWRAERNSEFIIGRVYDIAIAAKQKTGMCMLYNATMRQEDVGGRFSLPFISSYNSKAIAEENIN